jgi:PAS domain S-box-containing protein
MRGLVESSPDIMARFDGAMRLVYANPLFMRLLKRAKDEVLGKTVRELGLPAEKAAALEESMRKAGEKKERPKSVIKLDERVYHVQVVPEDEKTKSFKVYAADISDRKRMEDALRRNEYELRSVVENTPDIFFRLNRQLQYIFVNSTYEKLTGLSSEQFIGKTNSQLGMAQQMVQLWQSAAQEVFCSGKEHTVEFETAAFFGKRYYSARIIPEFEKSGLVESVLVVARDITEKKHIEEEMASLKK